MKSLDSSRTWWSVIGMENQCLHSKTRHTSCTLVIFICEDKIGCKILPLRTFVVGLHYWRHNFWKNPILGFLIQLSNGYVVFSTEIYFQIGRHSLKLEFSFNWTYNLQLRKFGVCILANYDIFDWIPAAKYNYGYSIEYLLQNILSRWSKFTQVYSNNWNLKH